MPRVTGVEILKWILVLALICLFFLIMLCFLSCGFFFFLVFFYASIRPRSNPGGGPLWLESRDACARLMPVATTLLVNPGFRRIVGLGQEALMQLDGPGAKAPRQATEENPKLQISTPLRSGVKM